jgi:hypothetical protein
MGNKFESYDYCGVFLGDVDSVEEFIESVSIGDKIGWARSKNVSIVTFVSIFTTEELMEFFRATIVEDDEKEESNYNYFIMEADKSGIYFSNILIYDRLFEVFETNEAPTHVYDIDSMSDEEKDELLNKILDKGSNLTDYDHKLLELLSK